ncbi:transcriptional regulator [Arcticibacter tournemirensis]|uniref:Transcriptional regulator n=1 Tax=Arcticibacter tournemirensis TaxID=699437 RepID=A0A5M9HI22_9SPHI|nr:metalloregulator ArsR/SmtB family transcription factor [Arcticibacter tournemirensis]KAA8485044.1 transcriptional regulator [Arcticibacter tournemirensis]TQM50500.1 transcriptional regulator [Arcticibacter tournemirensis]
MRPNKFLQLLKTRGPLTAKEIAEELGITNEGARQQLVRLSEDGLVKYVSSTKGVGRPVQVYELTEQGNTSFPNSHAALTVQLLDTIKEQLGEEALDTVIASREAETVKRYKVILRDCSDLESLISGYTAIRTHEGYMAEFRKEDNGEYLLFENNCPIGAAASSCKHFCQSDMRILQKILGEEVTVERMDHIASGERRCTYRIKSQTYQQQ